MSVCVGEELCVCIKMLIYNKENSKVINVGQGTLWKISLLIVGMYFGN